MKLCAAALG